MEKYRIQVSPEQLAQIKLAILIAKTQEDITIQNLQIHLSYNSIYSKSEIEKLIENSTKNKNEYIELLTYLDDMPF